MPPFEKALRRRIVASLQGGMPAGVTVSNPIRSVLAISVGGRGASSWFASLYPAHRTLTLPENIATRVRELLGDCSGYLFAHQRSWNISLTPPLAFEAAIENGFVVPRITDNQGRTLEFSPIELS